MATKSNLWSSLTNSVKKAATASQTAKATATAKRPTTGTTRLSIAGSGTKTSSPSSSVTKPLLAGQATAKTTTSAAGKGANPLTTIANKTDTSKSETNYTYPYIQSQMNKSKTSMTSTSPTKATTASSAATKTVAPVTAPVTTPVASSGAPQASNVSSGYQQSDAVSAAFAKLQSLANQTPSTYSSAYQSQIDALLNSINNRAAFSYNADDDANYQIYKDQYTSAGKQAMADTMADAAALSGGYGNSYATTAGNQAYNGYMQNLNNIIPELANNALSKYNAEGESLYNKLSAYQNADNSDYSKYQDTVNNYYNQLSATQSLYDTLYGNDYGQYSDALSQNNYENEFNYQKSQDALSQSNYLNELAYQKAQDTLSQQNWQTEYNRSVYESDRDYKLSEEQIKSEADAQAEATKASGYVDNASAQKLYQTMLEDKHSAEDIALQLMNAYQYAGNFEDWANTFIMKNDAGKYVPLMNIISEMYD